MARIYVTGHRSPDTDSIASAVGYAELKRRVDPRNEYVPVRLGELNAQTRWVLERSGATEPELLVPVLDDNGALVGAVTERALMRRYVRESREPSRLDAPTTVGAITGVLEGRQLVGGAGPGDRGTCLGARHGDRVAAARVRGR